MQGQSDGGLQIGGKRKTEACQELPSFGYSKHSDQQHPDIAYLANSGVMPTKL